MALGPDKVRLQISVSKETAAKIEELAEQLNIPASRLAANLLEVGVEDNEWIIRRRPSESVRHHWRVVLKSLMMQVAPRTAKTFD